MSAPRYDPDVYLTALVADSRLKGYFVRRDDLAGAGITQVFCSNCGRSAGGIRFDDPRATMAEVICDECVEKLGKPPMPEFKPRRELIIVGD